MISVLILTKNEEYDLPGCLESVAWSDDVYVLDSESTDSTIEIAKSRGAKVVVRAFDGYASQRNFGLNLPFAYDWLLVLDADERFNSSLLGEIKLELELGQGDEKVVAFRFRRRDIWWGTWLKYSQVSPFFIRLLRVGKARYEREVNEVLVVDGKIKDLKGSFDHFPFSKGLAHWINKHNLYSSMEASLVERGYDKKGSWFSAFFSKDFNIRRLHQKSIFYRMPCRPILKFLYMILYRRSFLDGWAGIRYSILQGIYEYFIVLKTKEIKSRDSYTE
jgi:glycosyltransferase involved in cell wall biosynthesis